MRPMTVFVGPSNSGKSYMAALVYAMHRFFCSFTENSDYSSIPPSFFGEDRLRRTKGFSVDFPDSDIAALNDWINSLPPTQRQQHETGRDQGNLITVPESVASAVRPHLDSVAGTNVVLDADISRCFGVDPTKGLIRHSSKGDSGFSIQGQSTSTCAASGQLRYQCCTRRARGRLRRFFPSDFPFSSQPRLRDLAFGLAQSDWKRLDGQRGRKEIRSLGFQAGHC